MQSIDLYPHNRDAYEKLCSMLSSSNKACIVHPTGTGKSFIGMEYVLDHPSERVLWLTPSDYIRVEQSRAFSRAGLTGLPNNLAYMTYATAMSKARRDDEISSADVIVLDEFHHAGAPEWSKGVDAIMKANPHAKTIGLSATAIRYSDNLRNMADEIFEGHVASEMSLSQAWLRGLLPIPKYVTALYKSDEALSTIESRIERIKAEKRSANLRSKYERLRRSLEGADGLDVVFSRHIASPAPKIIVFCSGIDHVNELMLLRREWFKRINSAIHAYKTFVGDPFGSKDYEAFVSDESDSVKVLYCINQLNEGVHIDGIDAVIMARPTNSPVIFQQQLGRALDAADNRVPLVFDLVNNFDSVGAYAFVESLEKEFAGMLSRGERTERRPEDFTIVDEVKDVRALVEQIEMSCSPHLTIDEKIEWLENYCRETGTKLDGTPL